MNESIVDFAHFTTRSVSGDSVYIRALRSIRRMHILTAPEARGIWAHYTVEVNSAYHAYRCVRSHDQSIWKNGKFDPSSWVVVENPSKIGPPNFDGAIGEVWVFLLTHTHTDNQSNKFFHLGYRSQIWKDLKHLWPKTRGFTPCAFWGYCWWQIMFRGPNPPKTHFVDHSMQNLL